MKFARVEIYVWFSQLSSGVTPPYYENSPTISGVESHKKINNNFKRLMSVFFRSLKHYFVSVK